MKGILDHMLQSQQFVPSNVEEYVALQLSKRLNDEAELKRYLHYVGHHTLDWLLRLSHQVMHEPDPAAAFHSALTTFES